MANKPTVKLVTLQVVVSQEEARDIRKVAKRQGISVSRLCRRILVPVVQAQQPTSN